MKERREEMERSEKRGEMERSEGEVRRRGVKGRREGEERRAVTHMQHQQYGGSIITRTLVCWGSKEG